MTVKSLIKKKNKFYLVRNKAIHMFKEEVEYTNSVQLKFLEKQYKIFKFQTEQKLKHMQENYEILFDKER